VAPLLDSLIGFDEVQSNSAASQDWSLLPKSRGSGGNTLDAWFGLPHGGPERVILTGFTTASETGLKGSSRRGGDRARPGDELFYGMCRTMADGARTILLTRWRTGGRTNFELVREFARELLNAPASEAWQRACLLARETPLDAIREPRLKRSDETGEMPTAAHPFFWAGYLLVDTSPRVGVEVDDQPDAAANAAGDAKSSEKGQKEDAKLPPPEPAASDPKGDDHPSSSAKPATPAEEKSAEPSSPEPPDGKQPKE
jgi:hypothetical protein